MKWKKFVITKSMLKAARKRIEDLKKPRDTGRYSWECKPILVKVVKWDDLFERLPKPSDDDMTTLSRYVALKTKEENDARLN